MNAYTFLRLGATISLIVLSAVISEGGSLFYDFNNGLPTALTVVGAASVRSADGASGQAGDGYLSVTDAINQQATKVIFPDFNQGSVVKTFTFDCDVRIGGGTDRPADGFSINFVRASDPALEPTLGGWSRTDSDGGNFNAFAGVFDGLPEEGATTGLAIGFDAWQSDSIVGVQDVAGISVRVDGNLVAQFPSPLKRSNVFFPGQPNPGGQGTLYEYIYDNTIWNQPPSSPNYPFSMQTGAQNPSRDDNNPNETSWKLLKWEHFKVQLAEQNTVKIFWKGNEITPNGGLPVAFTPTPGRFILGGRTGGANEVHHIDNILLSTESTETKPNPPTISAQPIRQTVRAGDNVSFTVTAIGSSPLSYLWRFNGMAISGATSATLNLNSVGSGNSGGYSVSVSNPYGSITSVNATLAVLDNPTGGVPPKPPTYSPPPPKQSGKDSLILITHGWQPLGGYEAWTDNTGWVDDMAIAINQNLTSHGFNNWQVSPYKWLFGATGPFPWLAQANGYDEGEKVGQAIVNLGFTHVHLIGHSAGAALVQGALTSIKSKAPTTVVHATFLDPYVGFGNDWRGVYGVGADWSDSYFCADLTGSTTEGALGGAFNVDVTWLDEHKILYPVYNSSLLSTPDTLIPSSYQARASHPWPHDFYQATVTGGLDGTEGLGFPLSMEGGGWDNRGTFPRGVAPRVLGSVSLSVLSQGLLPVRSDPLQDLNTLPLADSGSGTVQLTDKGFSFLTPANPAQPPLPNHPKPAGVGTSAWLSIGVTVTNQVNFVSFDAQFTSAADAAGLLTVYWNTNQIGAVDESVTLAGLHSYTFALPTVFEAGNYALGFSLDRFTNVVSSLTVTNVATGFVGVTQPITLAALGFATNGAPVLKLTGAPGYNYLIQASTNLLDWTPTALLVNTNGTAFFAEPGPASKTARFYRATLP